MFDKINQYKEEFKKNKTVTITDLFSEDNASAIREDYLISDRYKTSFFTGETTEEGDIPLQYAEKGTVRYDKLTKQSNYRASQNQFSYRFSRTPWVQPKLAELWSSEIFNHTISYITGYKNLQWNPDSTFTSKYEAGDFLYTHTDKDNGTIAFVYHLTTNWLPGYGGLFMKMPNWVDVEETVTPKFNALTIFDVTGEGVPHQVSKVIEGIQNARIAYSGWFQSTEK